MYRKPEILEAPMRIPDLTVTLLIAAVSTPALAWNPYGYAPNVPPEFADRPAAPWAAPWAAPGAGAWGEPYPFAGPMTPYAPPPEPFGPTEMMDPTLGFPPGPWDSAPGGGTSAPPQYSAFAPDRRQLSISRRATQDAYTVEIRLVNIDPEQVQITPEGRGLRIGYQTRSQDYRQDVFEGGYRRGYSTMSGSASQRLSFPPDADLAAMSREVTTDRILLDIPRMSPGQSDAWSNEVRPQTRP
jgi:hypothetical protein